MSDTYFRLFASCVPVKGAARSIICDTQRGQYRFIPNELFTILTEELNQPVATLTSSYGEENRTVIEEYFQYLEAEEFGFRCDAAELAHFPAIAWRWDHPSLVHHAIIDADAQSEHPYENIFEQLEDLGCKHLQLRIYEERPLSYIETVLQLLEKRRIISVEIILPFAAFTTEEALAALITRYPRIQGFVVHTAPHNQMAVVHPSGMGHIIFTQQAITNHSHCGIIQPGYFAINANAFAEAQQLNSCLNRKISIDNAGNICNCPSLPKTYGHVSTQLLRDVVQQEMFRRLWQVTKDQVSICRDCEFRYICTDCRAFVQDVHDPLSKPAKCKYDPYTATWQD
jgi:SPASM domain peptide maturase of grasp-with-spasm system